MKEESGGTVRPEDLFLRTKKFALRIIRLYGSLPKSTEAQVLGKQLLRSGTSVGAQYWEGQHSKSDADLINKLEGCLQELNQTMYWLELLCEAEIVQPLQLDPLRNETRELTAILITIVRKLKSRPKH